jgi:hypothetical protein
MEGWKKSKEKWKEKLKNNEIMNKREKKKGKLELCNDFM